MNDSNDIFDIGISYRGFMVSKDCNDYFNPFHARDNNGNHFKAFTASQLKQIVNRFCDKRAKRAREQEDSPPICIEKDYLGYTITKCHDGEYIADGRVPRLTDRNVGALKAKIRRNKSGLSAQLKNKQAKLEQLRYLEFGNENDSV